MAHLITSSLLDSYAWLTHCPSSWKQRANEEFIGTIRRAKVWEPSPEAQRGIDFERMVCDRCNVMDRTLYMKELEEYWRSALANDRTVSPEVRSLYLSNIMNTVGTFYDACKGGAQQVKLECDVKVYGEEYTLFGYADVVMADYILDLKTCTKYKGEKKYTDRAQHHVYNLANDTDRFVYLVADYKSTPYPLAWHAIDLTIGRDTSMTTLKGRIGNMVHYLQANNLWEDYVNIFSRGQ